MVPRLEELLRRIEQKLDWGDSSTWQSRDFENLNQRILDETGISLSASTLRRLWGKVEYNHMPSATTLDTLARFAGFEKWRDFQKAVTTQQNGKRDEHVSSSAVKRKFPVVWTAALATVLIVGIVSFLIIDETKAVDPVNYLFSSKPITNEIPNSVIFTYDASSSTSDSVFIQQSWDTRTRTLVDKTRHTLTSVYYEPGFYQAKLIVDNTVVKEHPLLIPTRGWLGMINNKPVPLYLRNAEFLHSDRLQISGQDIARRNIEMNPTPPVVKYYNVGNFETVPVSDFTFSADIRNDYGEGSGVCQLSYIFIITDGAPITIPLSARGCVSELFVRATDTVVSGKKEDLSGFGVDFSDWVHVSCKGIDGKISYDINGKEVLSLPVPAQSLRIVGIQYYFVGTGSVKAIRLSQGNQTVFSEF